MDGIFDTEVEGNATFNYGSANFRTQFDGLVTLEPVTIDGNLTVTSTGVNNVAVGSFLRTGLTVGKNLTISGGSGSTLTFDRLRVGGASSLSLGTSNNTVNIDESVFVGVFDLKTKGGSNDFDIEEDAADTLPTEFRNAAAISLGAGPNAGYIDTNGASQDVYFFKTVVGTGATWSDNQSQIIFPFGGSLDLT
jgi:hypothetical protein